MLDPGDIDFPRTFSIVGSLSVCEESLLTPDVMQPGFDVSGLGRTIAGRSSKFFKNLILAEVTHSL